MSEGPVSFGKPLMFLVVLGCAGGGYYAYNHWPAGYDSNKGWTISMPHGWEAVPANDPTNDSKVHCQGPILDEQRGAAWAMMLFHGTLAWPDMITKNLPIPPDKVIEEELDHKRALLFEYEDLQNSRWMGCAVERGDALIYYVIGCQKPYFEANRAIFEKSVRATRCQR
jgi:hypothetical protein